MKGDILQAEREYLAQLLEAIQRCTYFLSASDKKVPWPLNGKDLEVRKKDEGLFESLVAINERFAKLQDTLGAAMRHAALLLGEPTDNFLKVLAVYEKASVIESIETWQRCRTARNLAAHDYETNYVVIAGHFNSLHELQNMLYQTAGRFITHCIDNLGLNPTSTDFSGEFAKIVSGT